LRGVTNHTISRRNSFQISIRSPLGGSYGTAGVGAGGCTGHTSKVVGDDRTAGGGAITLFQRIVGSRSKVRMDARLAPACFTGNARSSEPATGRSGLHSAAVVIEHKQTDRR